jgi:hypothetical protein
LGASLAIENSCVTATKRFGFETSDPANWSAMADWLRTQSDNYEAVLRSTLESLTPGGKRQRRRESLGERSSAEATRITRQLQATTKG